MPMSINRSSAAPVVHLPGGGESTSLMGMTIVCKVTGQPAG